MEKMEAEQCLIFESVNEGIKITFIGVTDWPSNTILPITIKRKSFPRIIQPNVSLGNFLTYDDKDFIRDISKGTVCYKPILKYELCLVEISFNIHNSPYTAKFYFPLKYGTLKYGDAIDKYRGKIEKYTQRLDDLERLKGTLI